MLFFPNSWNVFHRDQIIAVLLVIAALIQGGIYLAIFPPWQAPDETSHFQAVEMLVRLGRFANWEDYGAIPLSDEFVSSLQEHQFWQWRRISPPAPELLASRPTFRDLPGISAPVNSENYPPLYYWILSFFYRFAPSNIVTKLYILRLTSVFLLAAIIFMSWQISKNLFPDDKLLALSVPVVLLFFPMHIHINSAITTDVLAEFICTAIFLVLVLGFKDKFSGVHVGIIIFLLLTGIYTKRTTLFMIPLVAGVLMIYLMRLTNWSSRLKWSLIGTAVILVGMGIALLTLLPTRFYVNMPQVLDLLPSTFSFILFPANGVSLDPLALFSSNKVELYRHSIWIANATFWGAFGWANVSIDITLLQILQKVVYLAAIGSTVFVVKNFFGIRRRANSIESWRRNVLIVFLMAIILVLLVAFAPVVIWQDETYRPQARYIFPAIVPISIYFLLGIRQLTPNFYNIRRWVPVLVCLFFFLLNTFALTGYIIPYYYGSHN
jgi:4-amino-4-deoxy-L-arabinose transferase-like glycosyltransferase